MYPLVSVSSVALADGDLDGSELGGAATWEAPLDTSTVTAYTVGLASDTAGADLAVVANVDVGTNAVLLPVNTAIGTFTHLVVYTRNAAGMQPTPAASSLSDADAEVSAVAFADKDLDGLELGGDVTWSAPVDDSLVTHYVVSLATSNEGDGRSNVGNDVQVGTNLASIGTDTAINIFSYIVVYTKSSLAEQSTPVAMEVVDVAASVSSLLFVDRDLDLLELGGTISWVAPVEVTQVTGYGVYWSEDTTGIVKAVVTAVALGTNSLAIDAETALTSKTHILVYTQSSLVEQSTPIAHAIVDRASSVTRLAFPDMDLDPGELGGGVTFTSPLDASQVTFYMVYFALSSTGTGRVQMGPDVPVATSLPNIPMNTAKSTFTHVVVYSRSSLVEQSTPVGLLIQDASGGISNLAFPDEDLDPLELGGTVTWSPPVDTSQVAHYAVYLAENSAGDGRESIGNASLHTNSISLPSETGKESNTHIVVYASSSTAEQTTPQSLSIVDTSASVGSVVLIDYDLDDSQLGGTVTWSAPGDASQVSLYRVFFATSSSGASRSKLGEDVEVGTNFAVCPMDTHDNGNSYIVIYARSALAEQSTPTPFPIDDSAGSVSAISLTDLDLDISDLGGTVTWNAPADTALITYYTAYLATAFTGNDRSLIGSDPMGVLEGTTSIDITADTEMGLYTHLVVYARSELAEQTTPEGLTIVDIARSVSGIAFTDLDLDPSDLGGALTWAPPVDVSFIIQYAIYLATGSTAGVERSQLSSDLNVGTNTLFLFADTSRGAHTHFAIYARSLLAEQTTPAGTVPIADTDSTVGALTFGDRDFDTGEIGGTVSWQAPFDLSQVVQYAAFRAETAAGSGKVQIETDVAVGTNLVTLTVSTALGSYTHIVVYAISALGLQTTPAAVVIADTPLVGVPTQWSITNAESTAPLPDGRLWTADAGTEWVVQELQFFSDDGCMQRVIGSHMSSGQTGKYHGPGEAFDNSSDTAWHAQCAPCGPFEAWLGVVVSSVVRCVRWLQASVLTGAGSRSVAFQIGGQELARAQNLAGGRWEGLRYAAAAGGWQMIC